MKFILALILAAGPAFGATVEPEPIGIESLLTRDVLGYQCVKEDDLDAAFLNAGKGGAVPQTCFSAAPQNDCAVLEAVLGRAPNTTECGAFAYRWLTWFDPERSTGWGLDCSSWDCTIKPPVPASVPLPASIWLALCAIGLLALAKTRATKRVILT